MIGQDHVTEPLSAALRSGRVSHAYLFSGPRGCGKTTSARILARCLNCAQGPTPDPCGTCDSCRELGRGGGGSLDVVEIDAASHNGVEDARELRERALYAPARDRFKVFILDEAHMVTNQGFNALLKVVEEPPAHVKFIFATTEPEKVIGTIRSRTHHYPFRLVPPGTMLDYMAHLCRAEEVAVEEGVLPLVVRSGGGSVRDTESVLDQLMAGAEDQEITYRRAVALLGFTPESLLDSMVTALAEHDGGAAFRAIDACVESGQDPRRFAEDLLERLSDLVVLAAAGDGARSAFSSIPEDTLASMQAQAAKVGLAALSRAADAVSLGVTEMTGATSPRLQLELIIARMLVRTQTPPPAVGFDHRPAPGPSTVPPRDLVPPRGSAAPKRGEQVPPAAGPSSFDGGGEQVPPTVGPPGWEAAPTPAPVSPPPAGGVSFGWVAENWGQILARVSRESRLAHVFIQAEVSLAAVEGDIVTVSVDSPGKVSTFSRPRFKDPLVAALKAVTGVDLSVEAVVALRDTPPVSSPGPVGSPVSATTPAPTPARGVEAPHRDRPDPPGPRDLGPDLAPAPTLTGPPDPPDPSLPAPAADPDPPDPGPSPTDPDAEDAGLLGVSLLQRALGASIIEETLDPEP